MASVTHSQLGGIVAQHHESLPRWGSEPRWVDGWPWLVPFVLVPGVAAGLVLVTDVQLSTGASGGLLAGVGVLAGLLFQVLAWVAGRIASIADGMGDRAATSREIALLSRLDIARANIAYATLLSIVNVAWLGLLSLVEFEARWPVAVSTFLLLNLAATLLLVLVRVNKIGQDDRVAALTSHAARRSGR